MARLNRNTSRRFSDQLDRALNAEALRLMPELSASIAETLLPLALDTTVHAAESALRETESPSPARESKSESSRKSGRSDIKRNIALDVDTQELIAAATAVESLELAFDAVIIKGGQLDNMLQTTATGLGELMVASDAESAKESFGSLLKDIGNQAISGVQAMLLAAEAQSAVKGVLSFGATLITDAPLIAAAYVALEAAKSYVNSLDSGGVVLGDQLIMAHDRETVIPFDRAPAFFAEAVNQGAASRDSSRSVYRPEATSSTAARVRVSFGDMRSALRRNEIRQSRRTA
jgi:hypothetical protein